MTTNATLENSPETDASAANTRPRPSYDDVNTPVVFLIGIISAIMTLLIIWAVEGLYYHWHSDLVRKRTYDVVNYRQVDEINAQKELLAGVPDLGYESLTSVVPDVLAKYQPETPPADGNDAEASDDH